MSVLIPIPYHNMLPTLLDYNPMFRKRTREL
jgi:hypothetical protein